MEEYNQALEKFEINDLVNRKKLYYLVSLRVGNMVEYAHVKSIIKILIEEVVSDLFQVGRFNITNFGYFTLKKMVPRKFYNYQTDQVELSKGNNILRFSLFKQFHYYLLRNLDMEKTFNV